jgi:TPR repeat protein
VASRRIRTQPIALYNLAIMYAEGQGTRQSDINAYTWAALAAEGGYPSRRIVGEKRTRSDRRSFASHQ